LNRTLAAVNHPEVVIEEADFGIDHQVYEKDAAAACSFSIQRSRAIPMKPTTILDYLGPVYLTSRNMIRV